MLLQKKINATLASVPIDWKQTICCKKKCTATFDKSISDLLYEVHHFGHLQRNRYTKGTLRHQVSAWRCDAHRLHDAYRTATFRLQSVYTSHLPLTQQLKQSNICSCSSKRHRLNVAIANRSESHSLRPAGWKLMNIIWHLYSRPSKT